MRALMLAAGLGTRLRPITDVYAKPAVPFLGVPLFFWSFDLLREAAADRAVVNLHHLPGTIKKLGSSVNKLGFEVDWSYEVAAPLGSGGAVRFAADNGLLKDTDEILVANADEVILPRKPGAISRLIETHRRTGSIATMLTMKHPEAGTTFGGVWTRDLGDVLGFGKDGSKFPAAKDVLHYVGVILLSSRVLNFLPQGESNLLYDALTNAMNSGEKVTAHIEDLTWMETGNPHDFLEATAKLISCLSPSENDEVAERVKRIIRDYSSAPIRYWESVSGGRMLIGDIAKDSIDENFICGALEKEKAFAVIGSNASILAPVINSVVLDGASVVSPQRNAVIFK